jgi:hypothetical protein
MENGTKDTIIINAKLASKLTDKYTDVKNFEYEKTIMEKIQNAMSEGKYMVEVEIERKYKRNIIETLINKNYILVRDKEKTKIRSLHNKFFLLII